MSPHLPTAANVALVDLLSATNRYARLMGALSLVDVPIDHPASLECQAVIRDAEQALLAIFAACFGVPDVETNEGG